MLVSPTTLPPLPPYYRELVRLEYMVPGDPDPEEIRVRSDGVAIGEPSGYASWEDATGALSLLTQGAPGAAAVLMSKDQWGNDVYRGVGTRAWNHPFRFEKGEDLPATADDYDIRDVTFVGLVDGDRVHRLEPR